MFLFNVAQNTAFARDLLLGNPEWQNLSHMPAQGLFAERRVNNFFQVNVATVQQHDPKRHNIVSQ